MRYICLLFLFLSAQAFCFDAEYQIRQISIKDGLSQATVYRVYQDSAGFIWLGTQDGGLNKYNGSFINIYEHKPFCKNCISGNDVGNIIEFEKNKFFISTWGGGLNIFDAAKEEFETIFANNQDSFALKDNFIQSLHLDKNKTLWVGTLTQGLFKASYPYSKFIQYNKENDNIPDDRIWSLEEDENGNIWVGTGKGLSYHDVQAESFENYLYNIQDPTALNDTIIRTLFVDSHNKLWVGTGVGFSLFNKENKTFKHYKIYPNQNEINAVNDIIEDNEGFLWIGTFKTGLIKFNPKTEKYVLLKHDPNEINSLAHDDVRSLYIDNSNNLWIATRGGGVNIIDLKPEKFKLLKHNPTQKKSLSNSRVTGLLEIENQLWIATSGGGINILDLKSSELKLIHRSNSEIISNTINTVFLDTDENVWIGYWDKGIQVINSNNYSTIPHHTINSNLTHEDIEVIFEDSYNYIWIGTPYGLNQVNKKTGEVFNYTSDLNDPNSISDNYIFSVNQDSKEQLWVGTFNGLNKFDYTTKTFTRHFHSNHKDSLASGRVHVIYNDSEEQLWIGTQLGLHKFIDAESRFEHYVFGDRIIDNTIFSILDDEQDNLWLGMLNGLIRFNRETSEFEKYELSSQIQFNDFSERNALKLTDGSLLFGGVNGLTIFNSNEIKDHEYKPNIVLTKITVQHQDYSNSLPVNIAYLDLLELNYYQSTFSLSFSSLEYTSPDQTKYKYKLTGFDDDWIDNKNSKTANYTNIPPGSYIFKVIGSNSDGVFNKVPRELKIIIRPPFWERTWFIVLGLIVALSLLYVFIKTRENILRRSKKELEKKVKERTIEIEQQKEEIKAQAEELNKLSIVASETENAVSIFDRNGKIEWINYSYTKKYGYSLEQLLNDKSNQHLEMYYEYIDSVFKSLETVTFEHTIEQSEDEKRWIQTSLTPIKDFDGKLEKIIAIDSDITALKIIEDELRQKNEDTLSSIHYAKRIQEAIMPSFEKFQKIVPTSFLLYLPKDIVSGDFFWFTKRNNKIFVVISDCTGHGVPGAFMSIIGITFLNEIVKQREIYKPNEILDTLNNKVINALFATKKEYISTDGMDIALFSIDLENNKLEYSGANHPLYLIRNNVISQFEGDRMPIGMYQENFKFTLHKLDLLKDDRIYSSSDGIIDQFGGSSGKKFKSKKFKNLLLTNHNLKMEDQKDQIVTAFYNWKGNIEQIDDVMVFGMRI